MGRVLCVCSYDWEYLIEEGLEYVVIDEKGETMCILVQCDCQGVWMPKYLFRKIEGEDQ